MVEIVAWLIFGGIAGWIASLMTRTDISSASFTEIGVGILGAAVGGFFFSQLTAATNSPDLSAITLIAAIISSVAFVLLQKSLERINNKRRRI